MLSPTRSQCTLSELATRPLVLVILVRRPGDVLATRPHGDTRYTLTLQYSVLASRPLVLLMAHSRSSMRRVRHEAAVPLAAELRGAMHTAYSLKTYSFDGRQRGKTQPACVNGDSHLAFSSTASHPHTLITGISFAHLSLRLFSTAYHLYGGTIITPTWKRKRLITLRARR